MFSCDHNKLTLENIYFSNDLMTTKIKLSRNTKYGLEKTLTWLALITNTM